MYDLAYVHIYVNIYAYIHIYPKYFVHRTESFEHCHSCDKTVRPFGEEKKCILAIKTHFRR